MLCRESSDYLNTGYVIRGYLISDHIIKFEYEKRDFEHAFLLELSLSMDGFSGIHNKSFLNLLLEIWCVLS